jgi:hypothetical protein
MYIVEEFRAKFTAKALFHWNILYALLYIGPNIEPGSKPLCSYPQRPGVNAIAFCFPLAKLYCCLRSVYSVWSRVTGELLHPLKLFKVNQHGIGEKIPLRNFNMWRRGRTWIRRRGGDETSSDLHAYQLLTKGFNEWRLWMNDQELHTCLTKVLQDTRDSLLSSY